jgi:hypothetical protein
MILRFEIPLVVTTEEIDEWYKQRGTCCKVLHIPATNPRPERIE